MIGQKGSENFPPRSAPSGESRSGYPLALELDDAAGGNHNGRVR